MEEADKGWMMIRMVGGWVFLLVPAHQACPRQRAVKQCCRCCVCNGLLADYHLRTPAANAEIQLDTTPKISF